MNPCYFCRQDMGERSVFSCELECNKHPMTTNIIHYYSGYMGAPVTSVSFRVAYNEHFYRIVLRPQANSSEIDQVIHYNILIGDYPPNSAQPVEGHYLILYCQYLLSITPENAIQKLKTILTFL